MLSRRWVVDSKSRSSWTFAWLGRCRPFSQGPRENCCPFGAVGEAGYLPVPDVTGRSRSGQWRVPANPLDMTYGTGSKTDNGRVGNDLGPTPMSLRVVCSTPWESRILRTPCRVFTVRIIRLGRSTYEVPSRSLLLRLSNTSSSVGRSAGSLAIMRITSWSST